MKNFKEFRLWSIVYPLFLYWAVVIVVMMMAQMAIGTDDAHYMICQIIASLVALLVTYLQFYRFDRKLRIVPAFPQGKLIGSIVCLVLGCLLLAFGLNDVILMSPLTTWSGNYQSAVDNFYGGAFVFQILGAGLIVPIAEELIYRGVTFRRLRTMMGFVPAMILSALIFAVLHFNLVQFVYAFLCGLALAYAVEVTKRTWVSMLCHIAMNLFALIRTELNFAPDLMTSSVSTWLLNIGFLLCGLGLVLAGGKMLKGLADQQA